MNKLSDLALGLYCLGFLGLWITVLFGPVALWRWYKGSRRTQNTTEQ